MHSPRKVAHGLFAALLALATSACAADDGSTFDFDTAGTTTESGDDDTDGGDTRPDAGTADTGDHAEPPACDGDPCSPLDGCCDGQVCSEGTCVDKACNDEDEPCGADGLDCCAGMSCDEESGTCQPHPPCAEQFLTCTDSTPCCAPFECSAVGVDGTGQCW